MYGNHTNDEWRRRRTTTMMTTTGTWWGHQEREKEDRKTATRTGTRRGLETRHTDVSRDLGMFYVLLFGSTNIFYSYTTCMCKEAWLELETRHTDVSWDLSVFYLFTGSTRMSTRSTRTKTMRLVRSTTRNGGSRRVCASRAQVCFFFSFFLYYYNTNNYLQHIGTTTTMNGHHWWQWPITNRRQTDSRRERLPLPRQHTAHRTPQVTRMRRVDGDNDEVTSSRWLGQQLEGGMSCMMSCWRRLGLKTQMCLESQVCLYYIYYNIYICL
jgi:hypothetical protein